MKSVMKQCGMLAVASLLLGITGGSARSQVLEEFAYPTGTTLDGKNGGSGWATGWFDGFQQGTFTETVAAGSLSFGSLATSGDSYDVSSAVVGGGTFATQTRFVAAASILTEGTTAYISFLVRPSAMSPANGSYFGITFGDGTPDAFVGGGGGSYVVGISGTTNNTSTGIADTIGVTRLLVFRADLTAGNDTLRLYVDPVVGGGEPLVANATRNDFDLGDISSFNVVWGQGGSMAFDELRTGTTFASVTPSAAVVPEAGTATLVLGATLGCVGLLRRRVAK